MQRTLRFHWAGSAKLDEPGFLDELPENASVTGDDPRKTPTIFAPLRGWLDLVVEEDYRTADDVFCEDLLDVDFLAPAYRASDGHKLSAANPDVIGGAVTVQPQGEAWEFYSAHLIKCEVVTS